MVEERRTMRGATSEEKEKSEKHVLIKLFTRLPQDYYGVDPNMSINIPLDADKLMLRKLLQNLLALDELPLFDFLIDGEYLGSTIHRHLIKKKKTSEDVIYVEYTIACRPGRPNELQTDCDWLSTVEWIRGTDVIMSASYDGSLKAFDLAKLEKKFGSDVEMRSAEPCILSAELGPVPISSVAMDSVQNGERCAGLVGFKTGVLSFAIVGLDSAAQYIQIQQKKAHNGGGCVVISRHDNHLFASAGWDGALKIWKHPLATMSSAQIESLFESDPMFTHRNKKLKESPKMEDLTPVVIQAHALPVTDIVFGDVWNSPTILSTAMDGFLHLSDFESLTTVAKWKTDKPAISLTLSKNNQFVATAHDDGLVRIWDLRSPSQAESIEPSVTKYATYKSHAGMSTKVRWHLTSEHIVASTGLDGYLTISDIRNPRMPLQRIMTCDDVMNKPVRILSCAWTPNNYIYTGGSDGTLRQIPLEFHFL